jgi:XapX domain-containing protein
MKIAISLLIGLAIGAGCRWFDIPVPSPPTIVGVLLILSITAGYIAADKVISARASASSADTRP